MKNIIKCKAGTDYKNEEYFTKILGFNDSRPIEDVDIFIEIINDPEIFKYLKSKGIEELDINLFNISDNGITLYIIITKNRQFLGDELLRIPMSNIKAIHTADFENLY
jgi:hypothetical protein